MAASAHYTALSGADVDMNVVRTYLYHKLGVMKMVQVALNTVSEQSGRMYCCVNGIGHLVALEVRGHLGSRCVGEWADLRPLT